MTTWGSIQQELTNGASKEAGASSLDAAAAAAADAWAGILTWMMLIDWLRVEEKSSNVLIPAGKCFAQYYRIGRDYPDEQVLNRLCERGCARTLSRCALVVELKFSSLLGSASALNSFGWAGIIPV
jgi:hypothetical protein